MIDSLIKNRTKYITSLGAGFLVFLVLVSFANSFSESSYDIKVFLFCIFAIGFGVLFGKFLATHVSVCDHEHVDNTKDISFVLIVCLTSLGHTVIDGSVLYSAWFFSASAGVLTLFALAGHEIFRTIILFGILRAMNFPKWMSIFSVFGISIGGIVIGFILGGFLNLGLYEGLVHVISIFLYTIVVTDVYVFLKKHHNGISYPFLLLGVIIGLVIELVISVH